MPQYARQVLTPVAPQELQARITNLDDAIGKETRIAQAAARLHDQPGSGPVQGQRRSE